MIHLLHKAHIDEPHTLALFDKTDRCSIKSINNAMIHYCAKNALVLQRSVKRSLTMWIASPGVVFGSVRGWADRHGHGDDECRDQDDADSDAKPQRDGHDGRWRPESKPGRCRSGSGACDGLG